MRLRPGLRQDGTGMMNYVVVPLMDGQLRIVGPNGEASIAEFKHGVPYYRDPGVEHDVVNNNDYELGSSRSK